MVVDLLSPWCLIGIGLIVVIVWIAFKEYEQLLKEARNREEFLAKKVVEAIEKKSFHTHEAIVALNQDLIDAAGKNAELGFKLTEAERKIAELKGQPKKRGIRKGTKNKSPLLLAPVANEVKKPHGNLGKKRKKRMSRKK